MRKSLLSICCILISAAIVSSCGISEDKYNQALSEIDALKTTVAKCENECAVLRDSIKILKFPADQRYNQIVKLVKEGSFNEARRAISELKKVFPASKEAEMSTAQLAIIEKKEAEKKAEEERIKALGFKVFKDQPSFKVKEGTCSISGITYGRTFTFDHISDISEYHYEVADKGCTYILANLSLTSKENYAYPPSISVYRIVDGKLRYQTTFRKEYASWATYGAFLGNYEETSHDFAKVNTVRWKIAAEIPNELKTTPLVILAHIKGSDNGSDLSIEDVKENWAVVKILNRDKI